MLAALPLFLSVVKTAFNMVSKEYIGSDTAVEFINFGFNVATTATNAELKLSGILEELIRRKDEAKASGTTWVPPKDEIDALWVRINARDEEWDKI